MEAKSSFELRSHLLQSWKHCGVRARERMSFCYYQPPGLHISISMPETSKLTISESVPELWSDSHPTLAPWSLHGWSVPCLTTRDCRWRKEFKPAFITSLFCMLLLGYMAGLCKRSIRQIHRLSIGLIRDLLKDTLLFCFRISLDKHFRIGYIIFWQQRQTISPSWRDFLEFWEDKKVCRKPLRLESIPETGVVVEFLWP